MHRFSTMRSIIECLLIQFTHCVRTAHTNRVRNANFERFSSDIHRRVLKSVKSPSISPCIGLTAAKDGCIECNRIVETRCNCTYALGKSGRCSASVRVVDFGCRMYVTCELSSNVDALLLFIYKTVKILVARFIDVKFRK